MLFLALAVACSTGIAVIFKVTEGRLDRAALLTVNYFAAVAVAGSRLALDPPGVGLGADFALLALGATLGALLILGFGLFSKAIGVAGLSLATATMRLSVVLPFLASWLVWGEVPTPMQAAGLAFGGAAFVLISRPRPATTAAALAPAAPEPASRAAPLAVFAVLAALFVVGGSVDTGLKVFEEEFAEGASRQLFLLLAFGVAFALGVATVAVRMRRGIRPTRGVLGWGLLLGGANYLSVEFFLLALRQVPGTIAFPVNNVAIVGLATLLGVMVWKERLSTANKAGLALAALALVLLTA
jgi:drug/metabolite transporter (DMT)-like permease